MSSFGENYKKNDLLDDIQHYFSDGGTIEEMFDVLRYIFEYGKTPFDDLQQENQELKKQLEEKENQQKEFMEWLEGEIKTVEDKIVKYDELLMNGKETDIDYYESMINKGTSDACKEVLSKYKSIIGSDKSE